MSLKQSTSSPFIPRLFLSPSRPGKTFADVVLGEPHRGQGVAAVIINRPAPVLTSLFVPFRASFLVRTDRPPSPERGANRRASPPVDVTQQTFHHT